MSREEAALPLGLRSRPAWRGHGCGSRGGGEAAEGWCWWNLLEIHPLGCRGESSTESFHDLKLASKHPEEVPGSWTLLVGPAVRELLTGEAAGDERQRNRRSMARGLPRTRKRETRLPPALQCPSSASAHEAVCAS